MSKLKVSIKVGKRANGLTECREPNQSNDVKPLKFSGVLFESDETNVVPNDEDYSRSPYPLKIVWTNVIAFIILHALAFFGIYRAFVTGNFLRKYFTNYALGICLHLGVTAGYHRLWTHKSYKATLPFRVLLAVFGAGCGMNSIYIWCRDHRVHHKFSETHGDPHNAKRGFFFAHMGWLMCKKHPDVINKGKMIDLSDLEEDPVVRWQYKYFVHLFFWMGIVMPTIYYRLLQSNSWLEAFCAGAVWIYVQGLHQTWLVNSAAHLWGSKPYDKSINPAENLIVAILGLGEGWHNYHHVFPWDYKTSELGFYRYNITTAFIDFFAWIGWAYDLKTVPDDTVRQRVFRTGIKSEWVKDTYESKIR